MNKRIINYLALRGVRVIEEDMEQRLNTWKAWYVGQVDRVHHHYVYTGGKKKLCRRRSLDMAARVCQRWADLLLNEKVEITVGRDDAYTAKVLERLLEEVNFRVRGNNLIEAAFALGGGFMVQQWDGRKTSQKYILQDLAYPITYDSGRLREVAFCSEKTIGEKRYFYLETHLLDGNGEYVVDNVLLDPSGKELKEVPETLYEKVGILPKWETHSRYPMFQMIRPNIASRENFNSPFGVSIFSGATDVLETIDIVYDSYGAEFELGGKKVFVRDDVTNVIYDRSGKAVPVFDPEDRTFFKMGGDAPENEQMITEYNPALRTAEHDAALQTNLNCLSEKVGLGARGFKWENGAVSTATQVISENSDMFRSLKKHEELLREAIVGMVRGLLHIERTFGGDSRIAPEPVISVHFDDSIIEDTAEIKRQAMLEYNTGLIDEVAYYMDVYKLTEEQATAYRDKLAARRTPAPSEPDPEE